MPVRDEALLKVFVLQLFGHLLAEVGFGVVVDIAIFDEDAELAIKAALHALAVVDKNTGFSGELELLMLGKDVLFKALDRRYPSWLADEGGYFLNVRLNSRKYLNSRRAATISKL